MTLVYDYDYLVVGGGSGGVSSAKRAAVNYGKKVAVVEGNAWGGACDGSKTHEWHGRRPPALRSHILFRAHAKFFVFFVFFCRLISLH
jgi:choline dehydrogenase-like flavoprotein